MNLPTTRAVFSCLALHALLCAAAVTALLAFPLRAHSQAALLMEEPYGFFGNLNPTGHNAIYFARICADTPTHLRRCEPGELGSVIARYQGISGYDWIAIPLVPYLYSVEHLANVPARVNRPLVKRLRARYHEAHLLSLGPNLPPGGFLHGGWTELIGVAYERRTYAFRFDTTPEQDDALIARLNAAPNHTHFHMLYSNCADFARTLLNSYFPGTFNRSLFPDAGMTTPKQIAWNLQRYARQHPDIHIEVFEIPQIPGFRHHSKANKDVAESLTTSVGYVVPIAIMNPYLAGGIFVDYLARGRFHPLPKHPPVLSPASLSALTASPSPAQNAQSAGSQAPSAAAADPDEPSPVPAAYSGLREIKDVHE